METFNIEFSVFSLFVKQTWKMKLFCKCHNWDFKMVQAVFLELVWKKIVFHAYRISSNIKMTISHNSVCRCTNHCVPTKQIIFTYYIICIIIARSSCVHIKPNIWRRSTSHLTSGSFSFHSIKNRYPYNWDRVFFLTLLINNTFYV